MQNAFFPCLPDAIFDAVWILFFKFYGFLFFFIIHCIISVPWVYIPIFSSIFNAFFSLLEGITNINAYALMTFLWDLHCWFSKSTIAECPSNIVNPKFRSMATNNYSLIFYHFCGNRILDNLSAARFHRNSTTSNSMAWSGNVFFSWMRDS